MQRRLFLFGGASLALAGCASAPRAPETIGAPITLESAFVGDQTGVGHFRVWLTGEERRFTARLRGSAKGPEGARVLTVVEDFVYDDGQKDRLTWVFRQTGPGRWSGRREDTVGEAEVVEEGGIIRLSYVADFRSLSGVTRLGFKDVLSRRADGRILNDAIVSRAGIPVAAVQFLIG